MNYIKQVNQFYKLLPNNPLSSNAQCLYFYLLNKNNELGWIKEFTIANSIICGFTSLSRQALDRARNELKLKGYIDYKKGTSRKAGKYFIVSFDTQNDTQSDIQNDTQNGHDTGTLNKQNKTEKENIKKKYGEYKNVFFTDKQYERLKSDFPDDYVIRIQRLDDYMQSSGKKYKDCYATIRNWARKEGYEFSNGTKPLHSELKEVDTRDMTKEEYIQALRGDKDV